MRAFLFVVWTLLKNGFRAARDMFRGDAEDRHELEDAHDSDAYDSIDGLPDDEPGVPGEALRSVNVVIDGGDHDIEFSAPPGVDTTRWPGSSTSHGAFLGPEEREAAERLRERSKTAHQQPCAVVVDERLAQVTRQLAEERSSRAQVIEDAVAKRLADGIALNERVRVLQAEITKLQGELTIERQAHHATVRRADDKQAHVNTCNDELRRVQKTVDDKHAELNKEIQRLLKIDGLTRRALRPHVVGADRYVLHTVARIAAAKLTAQAQRIAALEAQLSRASGRKAPPATARAKAGKSAKRAR